MVNLILCVVFHRRIVDGQQKAALSLGKDGSFKMRRLVWFPASREERRERGQVL
jgi:hypothetical protein